MIIRGGGKKIDILNIRRDAMNGVSTRDKLIQIR